MRSQTSNLTFHTPHTTHHTPHLNLTPLTSHLSPHTSHLTPLTSHLSPHTSHLSPHTSHLTLHTSHLTTHTSHLTPHTSHLTPLTSHLNREQRRRLAGAQYLQSQTRRLLCTFVPDDDDYEPPGESRAIPAPHAAAAATLELLCGCVMTARDSSAAGDPRMLHVLRRKERRRRGAAVVQRSYRMHAVGGKWRWL